MKNTNFVSIVIAMILGVGVGIGVSPWLHSSPRPVAISSGVESPPESGRWKGQLQQLVDVDFRDYYRLKTLEDRYKKADEILGKIVLLFLQDLGLRVDPGLVESAKKSLQNPVGATGSAEAAGVGAAKPSASAVAPWKAQEKALDDLQTDAEIADFLDKAKFNNPEEDIRNFKSFDNSHNSLQAINGSYSGSAQITNDGKPETWSIQTTFAGTMHDGILDGTDSIKIAKNGKVFSNSHGSGDLEALRDLPDSRAMLIRASPSLYFQLYYMAEQDQLVGNIYRKGRKDQYSFIGTCSLRR